jgi:hypothetical protein
LGRASWAGEISADRCGCTVNSEDSIGRAYQAFMFCCLLKMRAIGGLMLAGIGFESQARLSPEDHTAAGGRFEVS